MTISAVLADNLGPQFDVSDGEAVYVATTLTGAGAPATPPALDTIPWLYSNLTPTPHTVYVWNVAAEAWQICSPV
jgi:hypothetical protein